MSVILCFPPDFESIKKATFTGAVLHYTTFWRARTKMKEAVRHEHENRKH